MSANTSVIVCPNAGDNGSSAVPTGTVFTYAGATAPAGWLMCDGTAVSRQTYASLFAVIGTTYGAGDGSTTFGLPNAGGKMVRGKGGTYTTLGASGGSDTVTIGAANLPPHRHGVWYGGNSNTTAVGNNLMAAYPNVDLGIRTIQGQTFQEDGTTLVANSPMTIANPYLVLNYMIKT